MIVVLSPHLDDATFSCGGFLLQQDGVEPVTVVTCFTQSVPNPTGFALECQLDKGLTAEVDYMELRRTEDMAANELMGSAFVHLPLPEAPHRGYHSAPELFAGVHADDPILEPLVAELRPVFRQLQPHTVLYPYGAGNHVDHLQVMRAVDRLRSAFPELTYVRFYDQPYTHRHPEHHPELQDCPPWSGVLGTLSTAPHRYRLPAEIAEAKLASCRQYRSQLAFQFSNPAGMAELIGTVEYYRLLRPGAPT